jgi:hypothetical protein
MKKIIIAAVVGVAAVSLTGCYSPTDRALGGAAIGGLGGAAVGSALSHGRAGGTLAGAAIGAASGAVVGAATAPQPYYAPPPQCARWDWDYYGNSVCVGYYNY